MNLQLLLKSMPALLQGALLSVEIALSAACIGFVLGVIIAILQTGQNKLLKFLSNVYVTLIRGTPMLVQILFLFFVLPQLGVKLPPVLTAIVAIGLNSGAFLSQVILSGIRSVPIGQIEAAKTLGLSPLQIQKLIVLPQGIRTVLPSLGNEMITLIKDSSLASVIGVMELTKQGSVIRSLTYDPFTLLLAVAGIYLALTALVAFIFKHLQRKTHA